MQGLPAQVARLTLGGVWLALGGVWLSLMVPPSTATYLVDDRGGVERRFDGIGGISAGVRTAASPARDPHFFWMGPEILVKS